MLDPVNSLSMVYASAIWRNAVSLALTEVVAVCDGAILLEIVVLEACDQFADQLESLNWSANEPFR